MSEHRRLPSERKAHTHHFVIGQFDGYIVCGENDDHSLGEVFIYASKTGSSVNGYLSCIAELVSVSLQHGTPLECGGGQGLGRLWRKGRFAYFPKRGDC